MTAVAWAAAVVLAALGLIVIGLVLFAARTARRAERAVPPLGRAVAVDGGRIQYLDHGSGPPLLLIHGLTGQMRHFTHSLFDLLERDYRVVIIDRPGNGYSTPPPPAGAAVAAQARTIAHFAEAIGLNRPLVVGHSLGGAVALALAVDFPDRIAGLALIAPATHPPPQVPPVFRGLDIAAAWLRFVIAWTVAVPLAIRNGPQVLATVFGPEPVPADFAVNGGGLLSLRPKGFIGASRDLVEARRHIGDMTERYQDIAMPVGVLFGTADRILDPAEQGGALVAKVPGVDYELVEGAGHMLPFTRAEDCARFIARMAQRVNAAETARSATLAARP
ncbi:MAG TPA: alpha/beta hydrolase [Xanthobacteraceae bacterium]|nr:alpha/beta hydrolase [Xanthobacteraceae bacterium]